MNKKKPFGEIFGETDLKGARYVQNGVYFDANYEPLGKGSVAPKEKTQSANKTDFENMHHLTLRQKVIKAGGAYVDRDSAIKFLNEQ